MFCYKKRNFAIYLTKHIHYVTAEQALQHIKSNERIFIYGGCATPRLLINALAARHHELQHVEITHLHTEGDAPHARPEFANSFHVNAFSLAKT